MRKICAIFDSDEQYAYRFMNYVNEKRLLPFEVVIFTQKGVLMEYLKESRVELLLIAGEAEELEEVRVGKVIKLSEDTDSKDGVYKYQSVDLLIKQVLQRMGEDVDGETALTMNSGNCCVYGVYSPVARSFKTSLAIALAMGAARNGRTLYINLEEFCGNTEFVNDTGGNLSELLYYFRNSKDKLKGRLGQATRNYGGFEYIPVCSTPEDYEEIMPEEWLRFLSYLVENGGYDTIVLDIGNAVHEAWKLIGLCKTAYMPSSKDGVGKRKEDRFAEYLKMIGRENLTQKICKVEIPYDEELRQLEDIGKLQWSKMGEYARGLIYG